MLKKPNGENKGEKGKGVIYEMKCKECNVYYIGETSRELKIRIKEHMRVNDNINSWTEVGRHNMEKHGNVDEGRWEVRIIGRESNDFKSVRRRL